MIDYDKLNGDEKTYRYFRLCQLCNQVIYYIAGHKPDYKSFLRVISYHEKEEFTYCENCDCITNQKLLGYSKNDN